MGFSVGKDVLFVTVYKVENPKHQDIDEIRQDFWNNWLIVSNRTSYPTTATVLYYCRNRTDEMDSILDKLDEDPIANGYPDYMYVGPSRGFIWSLSNV
jgi:hypothetical protein